MFQFLPRNDRILLHRLKAVQGKESNYITINSDSNIACRCFGYQLCDVEAAYESNLWEKLPKDKDSMQSSLNYLISIDLVRKVHAGPVYQITPDGWRNLSLRNHEIAVAIVTHVLFPSLVAFITTLLTLALKGN